jgi:hypothetical protein
VISRPGEYILENDVSSSGTCFSVQSDDISLNLNGHTLAYGSSPGRAPAFGILGVACWDPDFGAGNPCGGSFRNLTVYGGTIAQNANAPPFSHGIRLGQGTGKGLIVHDINFSVSSNSSIPIYTTFLGTESRIYNNKFTNNVQSIANRHQQQGQSIKFADSSKVPGPAAIYGNHIIGGPQGGIFSSIAGTKIYDNFVSQKGTYTNDFGIYAWADHGDVFRNTVAPVLGRGISIAGPASGAAVYDNTVVVIEGKINQEYGGCQVGGAYGIQFDEAPQKSTAFRNNVVAKADQCDAQALRVTDSREGSENASHDNTYTAERVGSSTAVATGFGSGGATGFVSERDVFVGDTSAVAFDWDGAQNIVFRNCKFRRGANPTADFVTFSFKNGKEKRVAGIRFIDSIFENGASSSNIDMKPIGSNGDWPGPAEYFIDWTVTLLVEDRHKRPIPNADVAISDIFGHLVSQVRTNGKGAISVSLTELRVHNTTATVVRELQTPHRVEIRSKECPAGTSSFSIHVDKTTFHAVALDCGSS